MSQIPRVLGWSAPGSFSVDILLAWSRARPEALEKAPASTGPYHNVHSSWRVALDGRVDRLSSLWVSRELGRRIPSQHYDESLLLSGRRLLPSVGPGMGILKHEEAWRGSRYPLPERSPRGKTATCDEPWLCGVSNVMSDLSNHTVIMHTRYHPALDMLWLALASVHLFVSVARTYRHNFSSAMVREYPIIIVACFEWAMRYQAWRSPSHVSRTSPFTLSGTLARFIPPRRQSAHERYTLTV